jgi:D-3-phosphoglycerate dehydrogenase / 2-oxoglutarate reductase
VKKKVLITDAVHPVLIEGLQNADFDCHYEPDITYNEVLQRISDYEGLIINSKILVNAVFLDKANKLEFVARLGSGREVVDIAYSESKGIKVYFSPEGNSNAVAEHALGMLLAFANNLLRADREVRQKIWQREANRGFELRGKTIGLIGFGHTGSALAKKLSAMEMNILSYDKYKNNYTDSDFTYVKEVNLATLQKEADIISFHLPLTPETKHYCDADFFNTCKKGVVIVNTSRGNVVKTRDLIEALRSEKIGGACLDVFENEKVTTFSESEKAMYEQLYQHENVVLSPHIAGWTKESKYLLGKILLDKILFGIKKP